MQGQMSAMPYGMQQMGYSGMGMGQMGMGPQGGMGGGYGSQGYGASRGGYQAGGMQQGGGSMGSGGMGMGGGGTGQRRMDADHIEGKLFLGGLDNNTSKQSLLDYVTQWGEVSDYVLMEGRGFGFVTYADPAHAQAFLEQREHVIDGKRVEAKAAVPKNSKSTPGLTKKMFVGGTGEVSDEDFRTYFDQFGEIEDCVVLRKEDGTSRGFGFVTFRDEISVEKCLVMQHSLNGKTVELKRAVKKEEMGGGGMYGDAGYGGGGYGGGGYGGGGVGPMRGGGGGTRQNDWLCPVDTCRNKNFGWREACNRCQAPKPENPKSAMVAQTDRPSGGSAYSRSQGGDMASGAGGYEQAGMGMGAGMSSMAMGQMGGMGQMGMGGMGGMAMAPMGYGMGYGMGGMGGMGQMGMGAMGGMQGMGQMGQMGGQGGMSYGQQGQQGQQSYGSQGGGYGRTQGGRGYGASASGGAPGRYRPY